MTFGHFTPPPKKNNNTSLSLPFLVRHLDVGSSFTKDSQFLFFWCQNGTLQAYVLYNLSHSIRTQ